MLSPNNHIFTIFFEHLMLRSDLVHDPWNHFLCGLAPLQNPFLRDSSEMHVHYRCEFPKTGKRSLKFISADDSLFFFTFQNLIINHNYDARCRHRFSSHNDVHRLVCDTLPTQVMRLTAVRSSQEQTGRCRDDRSCWSFFVGNSCVHFKLDDLLEVCIEFPVQV